jgi:hypothetical protein
MRTRGGIALACCLLLLATAETASAPPQSTTHIGDITLTGSRVYEVRGETLRQKGNIFVGDNATLRLVDADLEILKSDVENEQFGFTVSGHGRLIMQNSRINLTNVYSVDASEDAEVILDGSEAILYKPWGSNGCLMVGGFTLFGNASIQATDSRIGMIDLRDGSSARATNTLIGGVYEVGKSAFKLDNCTAEYLFFRLENSTGTVKLRASGFVKHWYSKTDTTGFPYEGELSNTTLLRGLYLIFDNSTVRFVDSDFYGVGIWDGGLIIENSTITNITIDAGRVFEVRNSTIDSVDTWSSVVPRLELSGSRIRSLIFTTQAPTCFIDIGGCDIGDADLGYYSPDGLKGICWLRDTRFGNLTLNLGPFEAHAVNVTVVERFGFINGYYVSGLEVSGNIIFDPGCTHKMSNLDSKVTRTYDIRVTRGSEPVPGASIEVHGGNATIRGIVTDAGGYAQFDLAFRDRFEIVKFPNPGGPYTIIEFNMTSPVTLTVSYGGDVFEAEVGLLTTTPVEVAFPAYTRAQREAIAVFFSAALILLVAYMAYVSRLARAPRRS